MSVNLGLEIKDQFVYVVNRKVPGISAIKIGSRTIALSPYVGAAMGNLKVDRDKLAAEVEELSEEIVELRSQLAAVNVPAPTQKMRP